MKKSIFLSIIVLVMSAGTLFSQVEKLPVNFYYNTKSGRNVDKEMVNLSFMVTGIKDKKQYDDLYVRFSHQDGIRKVVMAPFDAKQESALCTFSYKKPLTFELLQKTLENLGVQGVYIDDTYIPVGSLASTLKTKQKEKQKASGQE